MEKREEDVSQSEAAMSAPRDAWATRDQRGSLAVGPMASTRGGQCMAFGHVCLSRAPSRSSAVSWASELRFRIRFWITNRDSLTHNYDYKNLKNGWEIISENDDEVNSTNENAE